MRADVFIGMYDRERASTRTPWYMYTYTDFLGCKFSHRDDIFSFTTSMNESPLSTAKRKCIVNLNTKEKCSMVMGEGVKERKSVLICGDHVKV